MEFIRLFCIFGVCFYCCNGENQVNSDARLSGDVSEMRRMFGQLLESMDKLNARMTRVEDSITHQNAKVDRILTHVNRNVQAQFNNVGCLLDTIAVECPYGSLINITHAVYGQYSTSCTDCCPPSADDCTQLASDNDPASWAALVYQCDEKNSCSYQYEGVVINECETGYVADYLQIYYDCTVSYQAVIGFTAYPTEKKGYLSGEVIEFQGVISNFGGHYDSTTSTFRCPVNAVYVFGVNINIVGVDGGQLSVELRRDGQVLVEAYAGASEGNAYGSANSLVVTECDVGQVIVLTAELDGSLYGHVTVPESQFFGYLISSYY